MYNTNMVSSAFTPGIRQPINIKKPEPGPLLPSPSLRHVFYISKIQHGRHFFFFKYFVQVVGGAL